MTTATIKKELQTLNNEALWDIISYAQFLVRKGKDTTTLVEEDEQILEEEQIAVQTFSLSDEEFADINRRRTALLNGEDKGLSHEEVMNQLKTTANL